MFFNDCLRSLSFPLRADWRTFLNSSVHGEPRGIEGGDVIASSPSFSRPAARAPRRVRSQANVIIEIGGSGNVSHHPGALVARVDLLRIQIQFENSKLTFLSKMYRPGSDSWVSQLRLDQQYRKHIKT